MVALGAESAQKHLTVTRSSLGTCQKLAGGRGVETAGGSQLFETQKREGS